MHRIDLTKRCYLLFTSSEMRRIERRGQWTPEEYTRGRKRGKWQRRHQALQKRMEARRMVDEPQAQVSTVVIEPEAPAPTGVSAAVSQVVWDTLPKVRDLLPHDLQEKQFVAGLWLSITTTKGVQDCDTDSLQKAIVEAALAGMMPHWDGFIVPFKSRDRDKPEAVWIEHYRGTCRALTRTGRVRKPAAEPVYEHDDFDIDYGDPVRPVRHRPTRGAQGELQGFWGAVFMNDGTCYAHYMTKADVDKVRARAPGGEKGAWKDHYIEMGRKTVLKNTAKLVDVTPGPEPAPMPLHNGNPTMTGNPVLLEAHDLAGDNPVPGDLGQELSLINDLRKKAGIPMKDWEAWLKPAGFVHAREMGPEMRRHIRHLLETQGAETIHQPLQEDVKL